MAHVTQLLLDAGTAGAALPLAALQGCVRTAGGEHTPNNPSPH
jgi:hypothetical protein